MERRLVHVAPRGRRIASRRVQVLPPEAFPVIAGSIVECEDVAKDDRWARRPILPTPPRRGTGLPIAAHSIAIGSLTVLVALLASIVHAVAFPGAPSTGVRAAAQVATIVVR